MVFNDDDRVIAKVTNQHGTILRTAHGIGQIYLVELDGTGKKKFFNERELMKEESDYGE